MDKLAKVRVWIQTRKLCTMDEHMKFYCKEAESEYNMLSCIEEVIDSMQEEPVSKRFTFKAIPRLLEMIEPTDKAKAYIAKLADILEVEGYSTDAKIVRERRKIMNGEKVPMATMDEVPVSEDLDKEMDNYLASVFNERMDGGEPRFTTWFKALQKTAVHFANWQKEQMTAKAVDGEVGYWNLHGLSVNVELPSTVEEGDKVKVIVTKED